MASNRTVNASRRRGDQVIQWMWLAILAVIVLIVTAVLWIVVTGIMDPPAPRSYHERQLDLLETVVKEKPTVPRAWADYARAFIAAKQYSRAERVLDKGDRAVGEETPELTVERARLAVHTGETEEALKLLAHALKVTKAKRAKEIAEMTKKGVTVDPRIVHSEEMAAAAEMQGDMLASEERWAEAVESYGVAIFEKPENVDYLVKRGAVYIQMDEPKKAKADFEAALVYVPDYQPAVAGLARLEKGSTP